MTRGRLAYRREHPQQQPVATATALSRRESEVAAREEDIARREQTLTAREAALARREIELAAREQELARILRLAGLDNNDGAR